MGLVASMLICAATKADNLSNIQVNTNLAADSGIPPHLQLGKLLPSRTALRTATGSGHITGKITDTNGTPLPGIYALLMVLFTSGTSQYWDMGTYAESDANGNFDLSGIPDGTYRVCYYNSPSNNYAYACYQNAADVEFATDIQIASGSTVTGVNAALPLAGRITGKVTDTSGNPIAGVDVSAMRWNGSEGNPWNLQMYDTTAADGTFDIGGLLPDNYLIGYNDYYGSRMKEFYNNVENWDTDHATKIAVTSGVTVTGIDAVLALPGHIKGKVTNVSGTPIANIYVYAYTNVDGAWTFHSFVKTDTNGNYDLSQLMANTYRLHYFDLSYQYYEKYYENVPIIDVATDVQLAEEATRTINMVLTKVADAYTVTPRPNAGGIISPYYQQIVNKNGTASFTVTAKNGYVLTNTVTGSCPQSGWTDNVWTTGPITANCSVVFNFNCKVCALGLGSWRVILGK
ncbi:hypothetical protein TI04_03965 [Achromatium sp. WMS2]|nr:hypothetical protein TI04_03965 [Achromatium sp. WMS2]